MKKILSTLLVIACCGFGFSQSTNIITNNADTAKTTTTAKKKLIRVNSKKLNAVQAGPTISSKSNNNTGTKEEEKSTPQ